MEKFLGLSVLFEIFYCLSKFIFICSDYVEMLNCMCLIGIYSDVVYMYYFIYFS